MEFKEAVEFYNLHREDEIIEKYHESISAINHYMDTFEVPKFLYKSTRDYDYYIELPCEEYAYTSNGIEPRQRSFDGMSERKDGRGGLRLCQALCGRSFEYIQSHLDKYIEEQLEKEKKI